MIKVLGREKDVYQNNIVYLIKVEDISYIEYEENSDGSINNGFYQIVFSNGNKIDCFGEEYLIEIENKLILNR